MGSERRRFRRAELNHAVPVSLRPRAGEPASGEIVGQVKNIGLAGLLCQVPGPCALHAGDEVSCHVSIPPLQRRSFPFQRLLGNGTIVRAIPTEAAPATSSSPRVELAIAFMSDVTALGTIEY